jgi:hypothetical protein
MTIDVEKKAPARRVDVNLSEPAARRFWAEHFRVSEKEIIEAVKQVGNFPADVKQFLAR